MSFGFVYVMLTIKNRMAFSCPVKSSEDKMDCKLRAKHCGGCPLLGLPYAAQLQQKEDTVRALLGRYGPVHPIRGMETPFHYRNKTYDESFW